MIHISGIHCINHRTVFVQDQQHQPEMVSFHDKIGTF